MKTKFYATLLGASFVIAATGHVQAAAYLAQTDTDEWSVSRNVVITSGTTANGAATNSATLGVLNVNQYTGLDELVRVVIRVIQPAPLVSQTIGASITIASGSDTFTSSTTGNRVTETTLVRFGDTLTTDLDTAGVSVSDPAYNIVKNSANYANATIDLVTPIERTLNLTQASTVLFDSDNEGSLTQGELVSIFQGAGTLGFGFDTTSTFNWSRTGTEELTATLSGTNSGQIIIEYYAIPEPSAALLGGLGALALLRRRRR